MNATVVFVMLVLSLGNRVAPKKMKNNARPRLLVDPIARLRNASRKPNCSPSRHENSRERARIGDDGGESNVPRIPRQAAR